MAKFFHHRVFHRALGAGALTLVAACSPIMATRGHLADPDRVALIKPGESTADEVQGLLGTPTAVGTFNDHRWYYIGQRTETTAFFKPETTSEEVVVISFDAGGKVTSLKKLTEKDAEQVVPVDRQTPTAGHDITLLEQLLSNVGRFSGASSTRAFSGHRPGGL